MKIGIDARFVGPKGTGIGKYTEKLILNLQKIDKKNQYAIFLRENNWRYLKLANKNFKKVLADISWYSIEEQTKLPSIFKKQNLDLLHTPHFNVPLLYRKKFIVTIHDLTHQEFVTSDVTTKNQLIFKLKKIGYKKVINYAISNSQKIITPSQFVKEKILEKYKINEAKIKVIYEAAEEEYFVAQKPKAKSQKPFIIYVGNAYPHKNIERLFDALVILLKFKIKNLKLVLVCPRDIFTQRLEKQIKSKNLKNQVELKGYLPAKELTKLFQKASAYVFPSLSEGFGIPGLNAMAAKVPAVVSNIPVFKEIYSGAALYFDPKDPHDIADKIRKVLESKKAREELIKKGTKQVTKYSWKKMAEKTLDVYNAAAK